MAGHRERGFWELSVSPEALDRRAADAFGRLLDDDPAKTEAREEAVELLRLIIGTRLTDAQREVVERYFFLGQTQAEIAVELGVAQQVVSKHLFGVIRNGERVGGAIKRLRALLEAEGVDPARWV